MSKTNNNSEWPEVATEVVTWKEVGLPSEFEAMVKEYRIMHEKQKEAETRKKELGPMIDAYLLAVGQKKVAVGNLMPVRCTGHTPSMISGHRLLEKGVTLEVIDYATVGGKEYEYVQVKKLGEEE